MLRILLLFCLLCCGGCDQPQQAPPLLEVGARQLSVKQFQRELELSIPTLSRLPASEQWLLKKQLLNRLVERELILGEAELLKLRVTPDELDQAEQSLLGGYRPAEFASALREAGQTAAAWRAALKLRLLVEKVSTAVLASVPPISADEVAAYYRANRESFRRPAELRARQMLLASIDEAHAILKRLRAGESFAELAKAHSRSPDREDGGNLGYFSRGELPPEFDRILFRLPLGQVSDPVESPYGVHLFLVERRRPAGLRPLAQVAGEISAQLKQQREEAAFQAWLKRLRDNTRVQINWHLLETETTELNSFSLRTTKL